MSDTPAASIVVPTRARAAYLDVTLASIMPQATRLGAEVIVVSDGDDAPTVETAVEHGARLVALPAPRCLNAARNAGVAAARGALIVFVDDDVQVPAGWLAALLTGAAQAPDRDVFGGPIHPRLEGGGPRACGREPPPITTLQLGDRDRDVEFVWGANMAIRTTALTRVGPFDETLSGRGDEEDWLRRYASGGGRIRYLAAAGLDHRRTAADSTLTALSRAAYALGRTARRNDARKGTAPALHGELRVLAGCGWHAPRRRCAFGLVMLAHSAGRLREALSASRERTAAAGARAAAAPADDFLSGTSGQVSGIRATTTAVLADAFADGRELARGQGLRLRRAAAAAPARDVLALSIERPDVPNVLADAQRELRRSHHRVRLASAPAGRRGKFENLNALLADNPAAEHDWLLVVDDDVRLPAGFLDRFLFLAERFELRIAQPAHRYRSHAAWEVTRRRPTAVVRETAFVEIGPVTAFHRDTFAVLLPFPPLRTGWGLDAHWSAVARLHGWRVGVVDATAVGHGMRPIAAGYDRSAAIEEARAFLAGRPYTPAAEARRTLVAHRTW